MVFHLSYNFYFFIIDNIIGDSEMSPVINMFASTAYPTNIYSSGDKMLVRLQSDDQIQGRGIYAVYSTGTLIKFYF